MDDVIRIFYFTALGLALLAANIWFVRTAYRHFLSNDYVISPFTFIDPSGRAESDKVGLALAQMMTARLQNIQAELKVALGTETDARTPTPANLDDPVLGATALFVTRQVEIPTNLFQPVKIDAAVGGVEVGGVFSYLQNRVASYRTIRFSAHERADGAVITADLSRFAPSRGFLWLESDNHPEEIATNAAFAILHAKLSDKSQSRFAAMPVADFRRLIETVIELDATNRRALRGMDIAEDLAGLLDRIEEQLVALPDWPELVYLAASTAEGLGQDGKAVLHYRNLASAKPAPGGGERVDFAALAKARLASLGALESVPRTEAEARFVAAAQTFARRMRLEGDDPAIAFVPQATPGVQAIWNTELKRYEVNPPSMTTAGLPQYVALMGRFFLRHYDRCWGDDQSRPPGFGEFWNEFRYATVDYLIQSHAEFSDVTNIGSTFDLYRALKALEETAGKETVQRLGLLLLERFDCDWSRATLATHVARIAGERNLIAPETVREAMEAAGLPVAPGD